MSQNTTPVHCGDNAKVWTGIRDIPIWAGEASSGNQLPLGPYRTPELIAIGIIMVPAIFWITGNPQSPHVWTVLLGAPISTVLIVLILRILLPKARPNVATRLQFLYNARLPHPVVTSAPPTSATLPAPPGKPRAR